MQLLMAMGGFKVRHDQKSLRSTPPIVANGMYTRLMTYQHNTIGMSMVVRHFYMNICKVGNEYANESM